MSRGDLLDDAALHHFVSNFPSRPLADRTIFGLLASQRDQLAGLFGSDPLVIFSASQESGSCKPSVREKVIPCV